MEETECYSQDQIYEIVFPSDSSHIHGYRVGPKPKRTSTLQYRHALLEETNNKMEEETQCVTDFT